MYDGASIAFGMYGTSTLFSMESSATTFQIAQTAGNFLLTASGNIQMTAQTDSSFVLSKSGSYAVAILYYDGNASGTFLGDSTIFDVISVGDLALLGGVSGENAINIYSSSIGVIDYGGSSGTGQTGNWTVDGTTFTFINGILTGVA